MSLQEQCNNLKETNTEFAFISKAAYAKFLKKYGIAHYVPLKRINPNSNNPKNKLVRRVVLRIMIESWNLNYNLYFFDTSLVQNFSLKSKCWSSHKKSKKVPSRANFISIKIFALLSLKGLHSFMLASKCNTQTTFKFLDESLRNLSDSGQLVNSLLLMDNAKCNHSAKVRNLAKKHGIRFLYNAVATPHLNTIEYFFEYLKREIRRKLEMKTLDLLTALLAKVKHFDASSSKRYFSAQTTDFVKILTSNDL